MVVFVYYNGHGAVNEDVQGNQNLNLSEEDIEALKQAGKTKAAFIITTNNYNVGMHNIVFIDDKIKDL